jgi:peptidoglycan/LPS O-acetylase OafA/YrhL
MKSTFQLKGHSARLQSLRGIAALSVALGHSFTVMVDGRIEDAHFALRPGNALLAAGEVLIQPNTAVILFYVLSGLVLGESLRRRRAQTEVRHLLAFAVRRLWRLLPVIWLSIVLMAAVLLTFRHDPYVGATGWFNDALKLPVTAGTLLTSLLGLSHDINGVLWSIQIELVMIALLPLAVWISDRCPLLADIIICGALCAVAILSWDVAPNWLIFGYCFYLGVFLPKLLSRQVAARLLGNGYCVSVSLALLIPVEFLFVSGRLWIAYKFVADALISAHLIGLVLWRPDCLPEHVLDHPATVWLGDVSYSFYCYAMALLIVTASVLLIIVPASSAVSDLGATGIVLGTGIGCVTISLMIAKLSFEWVEKPSMAIGRMWSDRIELGHAIPATV